MADDASTQQGTDSGQTADGADTRAHDGKSGNGKSGQRSATDTHLDSLLGGKGSDQTGTGKQDSGSDTGSRDDKRDTGGDLSEGQLKQVADMLAPAMEKYAQSIADRLVNAQGKQMRKGEPKSQDRDDRQDQQQRRDDTADDGLSTADRREAHFELRDELRELRPQGAGKGYREVAEALGQQYLASNLADGQRPVRAARTAAKSAADQLEAFAKTVREETVASLRRRGALVEGAGQGQGGGSKAAGSVGTPAGSEEQAIQKARSMAEEFNQRNGHKAAATT